MEDKTWREMIGLVQVTQVFQCNQQKKDTQMAEELNSQLICAQNLVKNMKKKKTQLKMMGLVQVHIKLNYQVMFHNILSEHDLIQVLEIKIILDHRKLMDLVQVLINYHQASNQENKQITESFYFIIWLKIRCKWLIVTKWLLDTITPLKLHLEMQEENSLIYH